jgi:hypothetical protein
MQSRKLSGASRQNMPDDLMVERVYGGFAFNRDVKQQWKEEQASDDFQIN